jgi:hypothetical protein
VTLLQAGLGAARAACAAGGAFRALRSSDEEGQSNTRPGSTELRLRQFIVTHYEGAFGAGITAHAATADVVVEWTEESYKSAGIDLSPSDTLGLRLTSDSQEDITVAARVAIPFGIRARVVAIGSYRSGDRVWEGDLLKDDRVRFLLRSASMERWSAGLSVAMAAPARRLRRRVRLLRPLD